MTEELLTCPDCSDEYRAADNYCRKCGMYVAALREAPLVPRPATTETVRYERDRAPLPAPVKKAATALAIGTALQLGVNLAGKFLATQATRQAASAVRPRSARGRNQEAVSPTREVAPVNQEPIAVSETILVRRIWIRRG